MQLFEQMRTRIHHYLLQKETSPLGVLRSSMYLDNANSIGILFDSTEQADREMILEYAERLKEKGKKVKLLAFFNNKLKSENFAFDHFNRQQLDWALRPQTREAIDFWEQPFDLLLCLSRKSMLPLDYIAARSKARFRVGPFTEKTFCYDLMIEQSDKKDLKAFIQQIEFYMKNMRPKLEAAAV
ncbi:MAG: hypothetical protein H6577_15600 [Lewinellaceae bacterium]|nr:hypothetical protein [Saprospiraceae bacterium]MCB9339554.1 hypothetical protein [Lewinellaceae bacterium]